MPGIVSPWESVGALRWDGLQKCHHHHHYHLADPGYYQRVHGSPRRREGRSPACCSDVMKNMWERSYTCDHRNSCHPDLGPHYCRVTPTLSKSLLTRFEGPQIEVKAEEEEEEKEDEEERAGHGGEEVDLHAVPASKSPSLLKTQKTKKKRAPNNVLLTPFPSSTRGVPCVLCHYCSRLLLLPPASGTSHLPPPFVKLKCSYCLKVSKFSTRHLHKSASSTSTQSAGLPAPLIFCAASPTSCSAAATQQMPGCYTRPTPPDDVSEPPSPNGELTFDRNEIHDATKELLLERNDAGGVETSNGNGIEYASEGQLPEHGNSGIGETPNGICESMLNVGTESMANTQDDRHNLASQETTTMSSVQDWVDSHTLEIECESDVQLREYPDLQDVSHQEIQKLDAHHHRPPLHEHFGYKNPMELLEKVFSSEDDEIKVRSETNSLASSSSSGVNASHGARIKCASFHGQSPSMQGLRGSKVKNNTTLSIETEQEGAQRSIVGILKRVVRDITVKSGQSSVKARVIVNGHMLSDLAIKQAEEHAGKLRPGSFWYDCKAGFWGVQGGPCLGILPPFIEELSYPMSSNCSNGDTQVYVNGRELHSKDLTVLSQRGLSKKPGRAYALGFDGILADETTGLELKPLGKLAPTVERKGKGFGMFTSDMVQRKTCDARQIKPATSSD